MDPSPVVQAGGVAGMFVVLVGAVITVIKLISGQNNLVINQQQRLLRENEELRKDNVWCEERQNILIATLWAHEIPVPDKIWHRPAHLQSDERKK